MTDNLTISKLPPSIQSTDYEFLRLEGIRYIEQFASAIWTDYNSHDPGITTLEALCYAITDLGHRTSFPIERLLTSDKGSLTGQFFTAAQILANNPLTIQDYRKLLIDIDGINNAWLRVAEKSEVPVYVNCRDSKLQLTPETDHAIKINGLYEVILDCEVGGDEDALKRAALKTLHAHRNLSEDFLCPIKIEEEDIGICADIEVTNEADIEMIEAEVRFKITQFLNPPVRFYSLSQMFAKGKCSEEIFEGTILKHGFIDNEELQKAELRTEIHASDIYGLLLEIEGITAIKKLLLVNYEDRPDGQGGTVKSPLTKGEAWVLKLTLGKKPLLNESCSTFTYFKDEVIPYRANQAEVSQQLVFLSELEEQSHLVDDIRDIPLPVTNPVDLANYTSIQEVYPETYGIGEMGLPAHADELRKAQAKQLKSYLLFFDQVLANYLSQLKHAPTLLSVEQDFTATYFSQTLFEIPDVRHLFKDFIGTTDADWELFKSDVAYQKRMFHWLETESVQQQRTNRILDHLLARFAESFNDYVLLTYQVSDAQTSQGRARTTAEIIRDKRAFLQDYPALSRDRGKAFNYQLPMADGSGNISGLQRRVARLMGIDKVETGSVFCPGARILIEPDPTSLAPVFQVKLVDDAWEDLLAHPNYTSIENARSNATSLLDRLKDVANYQVNKTQGNPDQYRLQVEDASGVLLAESAPFDEEDEAIVFKEKLWKLIGKAHCEVERIVIFSPDDDHYSFRLEKGTVLLTGTIEYALRSNALKYAGEFTRHIKSPSKYLIKEDSNQYLVQVLNDSEAPVAESALLATYSEAEQLMQQIQSQACCLECSSEGFYVIEHVLLRPHSEQQDDLLCIDVDCPPCECSEGLSDPYSFRISVVLPYWPERFQNMVFRHYFEKIIRLETPAHIALRICWVDCGQMVDLEHFLNEWAEAKAAHDPCADDVAADERLAKATTSLTKLLCKLNNVYPDAPRFHDCEDDSNGGGIILNSVFLD